MSSLLFNKSCYSLLESCSSIERLISCGKTLGYDALGLIDNNLYGAMSFYKKCGAAGIKPIIGLEIPVQHQQLKFNYLVIAKDNEGYQALMKLSSLTCANQAAVSFATLCNLAGHCIIISCGDGYLNHLYNENKTGEINDYLASLSPNFYIGLSGLNQPYNQRYENELIDLCQQTNVKTLPCHKSLYPTEDDYQAYCTLVAIRNNTTLTDNRLVFENDAAMLTMQEQSQRFNQQTLKNAQQLCDEIHLSIDEYRTSIPVYPIKEGTDSGKYLRNLCQAGLVKRLNGKVPVTYQQRLNTELDVICSMNYQDYFLIIYDFILYSRRQGIYVGPGRGSAVGSLVAYCLGITHLDPLQYGLIFERFLNPERISMPDIDVDFPDDRREEVIQYVREKYGAEHIAHIITFGTFAAKQVIRDVAKALNINDSVVDILNKNIERSKLDSLLDIYKGNEIFKQCINSSDGNRQLFAIALKLEGLPRHISTHAAGIVMSRLPLSDVVPITQINGFNTTQYSMEYLEELGLIKMDFLSLRNLSVIAEVCGNIKDINIMKIPLNDKKTFDLIRTTDVNGIFQIEQSWVREVIRKYQPTRFEDIAAIIALCRPGSMDQIPQYLQNKNNPTSIVYLHSDLKPILQETYGIIVYQEQIIQIACKIAGFTLGKADILRKAISKKSAGMIEEMKSKFIEGTIANGYSRNLAFQIYEMIEKFANFGFNKSHAVAYGLIAYQQAYLKANYPLQFYSAILNGGIGDGEKISSYIIECRNRSISILAPDINASTNAFTVENSNLRMPLTSIKYISNMTANAIVEERNRNGLFKNYFDSVGRLLSRGCNSRCFESLIKAGALDGFKLTHATMLNNLDECIRYGKLCQIETDGQIAIDLQLVSEPVLTNYSDNTLIKINDQYEMLNLYLYAHPISAFRKNYPKCCNSTNYLKNGRYISVIGSVVKMKEHRTKTGEMMCFVTASDEFGPLELVFMPKNYHKYQNLLTKGSIIYAEGEVGERQSMIVTVAQPLKERKDHE